VNIHTYNFISDKSQYCLIN